MGENVKGGINKKREKGLACLLVLLIFYPREVIDL